MQQFFRCLRSLDVFACHCWTTDNTVLAGILLVRKTKVQGTTCTLKDGDSPKQIIVQLPDSLNLVNLNIELQIKL